MEQRLEYGELWNNSEYVFPQQDGSPVDPDMVSREFPNLVKAQGLPNLVLRLVINPALPTVTSMRCMRRRGDRVQITSSKYAGYPDMLSIAWSLC